MKYTFIVLFVLAMFSCSDQHYTIIEHVNVFDGEVVKENVYFVFTSDGIESISNTKKNYSNSTIIDGRNKTILPPLINAHVHVRQAENLKEGLAVGIFGMLDMFTTDDRANQFREFNDSLYYAKFYSSNVGATVPGGHGTQFGVKIPTISDSLSPRQFIRDRLAQNADYIKITHEASMGRLDSLQLKEVIDEVHQQNMIAVAHISNIDNALEVVNQHVDGLAHIWYRHSSISTDSILNVLHEQQVFVIPTLSVIEKLIDKAEEIDLTETYLSMEELKNEVRKLNEKGIPILAGTDSPNFNLDYSTQFFKELLLLKECGLTEIEVLKSATTNIYNAFSLKEFDTLERGSASSFLLVDGQAYLRIEDILNKKIVWKQGKKIG